MTTITDIFAIRTLPAQHYELGGQDFRLVELPGADHFEMGNNKGEEDSYSWERPRHTRQILPFALGEYPVRQALWQAVYTEATQRKLGFDAELLRPQPAYFPGASRPVEQVSWLDAKEFCRVLSILLDKPAGYFRLPSEAEWEYAARAGQRNHLYAGSNVLAEVGWHDQNNEKETLTSGLLAPNTFGLYDLSGNVWEWCEDDWHSNYEGHPTDSRAWVDAKRAEIRVRRGGSWGYGPRNCRSASRDYWGPDGRYRGSGFRLAAPVQGGPHP